MRVCSVHGCPTIYSGNDSRCPAHTRAAEQQHWNNTLGYNTKGHRKRFRPGVLARDPICVLCHVQQTTDADHYPHSRQQLIELALDPNDPQYGRGLCSGCHKRETARLQPGGWNLRD